MKIVVFYGFKGDYLIRGENVFISVIWGKLCIIFFGGEGFDLFKGDNLYLFMGKFIINWAVFNLGVLRVFSLIIGGNQLGSSLSYFLWVDLILSQK